MKEIGQQLRSAREKKGQTVAEVAIATKINSKTIQSIEDGDLSSLPAKPFLRGFIQTYARHLELNVDEIMSKFVEVHGSTKPKIQTNEQELTNQESHEETQRKVALYKKVGVTVIVLLGALLITFIFKVIKKYEAENRVAKEQKEATAIAQPPSEAAAITPTETQTQTTEAVTAVDAKTEVSPENKEILPSASTPATTTPAAAPAPSTPPAPAPVVVATTPLIVSPEPVKPKEEKKEEPVKEAKPEVVEKEEKTDTKVRPQELMIEALDKVEIRFQKDNESEKTVKLSPEKIYIIRAKEKISLYVSDGGAVNIIHNGRDKGGLGNLGQSAKVNYP